MIQPLPISSITIDGGTQSRHGIDETTVKSYAEDIEGGAIFPPVTVFGDGSTYWLADGFHRVRACQVLKRKEIQADLREGTKRDALLFSIGANASHGRRRTNADKHRCVTLMLEDKEWGVWSDRKIAEAARVSHMTVKRIRDSICNKVTDTAPAETTTPAKTTFRKTTRGGASYKQETKNIGKVKRVAEVPPLSPSKSPKTQDEPNYHAFQALAYLQIIALNDPGRTKALEWIRVWIDKQLADSDSSVCPISPDRDSTEVGA